MSYISEALRRQVVERAGGNCEYCLVNQADSLYAHEIDHIIPEKHRGSTSLDNLCLACLDCNRHKGSDFASFDPQTEQVSLLFNAREQQWEDHFRLNGVQIEPLSPEGRVTVFVLKLNSDRRIFARQALRAVGRYPVNL